MIEQPLADDGMSLINHADLQRAIETPICLDESAHSLAHVQAAIRLGSCKVVNVKVARVGGLSASRDIQSLCAEHDIPCWIGGMLESAVGGAICAELATLSNFTYAGDIFPSSYFYDNDLGKPEIELSRSRRGQDVHGAGHRAGARSRALAAVDGGARGLPRVGRVQAHCAPADSFRPRAAC